MAPPTAQTENNPLSLSSRILRLAELLLLFVLPPALYANGMVHHVLLIPFLCILALLALLLLLLDKGFPRHQLWNTTDFRRHLLRVLLLFLATATALTLAVACLAPDRLWALPRSHPLLWMLVMVFYPLLSVYPQELIYRAFFFRRYAPLFGDGFALILASAAAFSYAHLIFGNFLALGLTLAGGLLFAWRYRQTRSLLVTSLEHALYGQLIFTIGLGAFFYHGTIRFAESALH